MVDLLDQPPLPPETRDDKPTGSQGEVPGQSAAPLGWGRLAARIAQWTTRGLFCAIIVAASVGFGRQVLQWWYEQPPESGKAALSSDPLAGLGEEERVHVFRFSNAPWEFRREVILGDARKAFDRLKAQCAQAAAQCQTSGPEPSAQQRQFLEKLKERSPVAKGPGWAVYAFHEGIPFLVGVRDGQNPSQNHSQESSDLGRQTLLASAPSGNAASIEGDRTTQKSQKSISPSLLEPSPSKPDAPHQSRNVVSWSFGIPSGEGRWTLYTLAAVSSGEGSAQKAGEDIPIPPESTLMYSLGVAQGPGLTLFRGPPRPETWKTFYETYFRTHKGRQVGDWELQGVRWRGRFLWPGASEPGTTEAGSSRGKIVEISFGPDAAGDWTGFLWTWAEDDSVGAQATTP